MLWGRAVFCYPKDTCHRVRMWHGAVRAAALLLMPLHLVLTALQWCLSAHMWTSFWSTEMNRMSEARAYRREVDCLLSLGGSVLEAYVHKESWKPSHWQLSGFDFLLLGFRAKKKTWMKWLDSLTQLGRGQCCCDTAIFPMRLSKLYVSVHSARGCRAA